MPASSLARCQRATPDPCRPWIKSSGCAEVRWTSHVNSSHTETTISTINAGMMNSCRMNPAEGVSTGGNSSMPSGAPDLPVPEGLLSLFEPGSDMNSADGCVG